MPDYSFGQRVVGARYYSDSRPFCVRDAGGRVDGRDVTSPDPTHEAHRVFRGIGHWARSVPTRELPLLFHRIANDLEQAESQEVIDIVFNREIDDRARLTIYVGLNDAPNSNG